MRQTHAYCDICGTQMDVQNADGDWDTIGIIVSDFTVADICTKHNSGVSSSRHSTIGMEFCSYKCLHKVMQIWLKDVEIASKALYAKAIK